MGELNIEKEHALLSASSAHKWLNCPPSVRLEQQFKNETTEYAEEGTLAHGIAELKARNYFLGGMTKRKFNSEMKKLENNPRYNIEMQGYTDEYLDYLKEIALKSQIKPIVSIETKMDYSKYAKDGFGTADCLMIMGKDLYVIDFKYGKGVSVSAEENPQLKLYALGALEKYKIVYPIEIIHLCIVQPRINNISEYELNRSDLENWGNTVVIPAANKAYLGIGDYVPGEHCRFCKAKGCCVARTYKNMSAIEDFKPVDYDKKTKKESLNQVVKGILTNEEIGTILSQIDDVESWVKDIKSYALDCILKGENIKGWKVVEGKSNRTITDIDKAFKVITDYGIDEALLYQKKPLSITELEKLLTKKKFTELIGDYIEKPKGAPTLAPISDKRESYKLSSAKEDFAEMEEN